MLANRVGALMQAAADKRNAGDHAAAAKLIGEAEHLLADNPVVPTSFQETFAIAEIAQVHGDAVHEGKLGDPCPHYERARVTALKAQDMTADDGEVERREAVTGLLADIERDAARSACAAPSSPRPDPAFVGHYYLTGAMETGSELLLRADGTFQWYMSYGAVDQAAHGAWGSDGGAIILMTAVPTSDKPLFTFREVEPWSEAAEDELLRRAYDEADDKVGERCPFLEGSGDVTATPAPRLTDGATPSPEALRVIAASALQRALVARAQAEDLARAEFASPPRTADMPPPHPTATEAFGVWGNAKWEALDAARKAGLPEPELAPPVLPAACTLTRRETARSIPSARWTGGLGVRVYDMASEQGARDVKVTLHFADGKQAMIATARRGLALLPGKTASPVISVDLAADYAPGRDQSVTVPPTSTGVIDFTIDAEQIISPPFTKLRLRIEGRALFFDALGRGRYERQP
jgi:hypothetical protein